MGSWIPCYNRRESDLYNCWLVNAKLSQAIHCGILIRHIVQCTINNHWQVASSVLWHLLPATSFTTCARHAPLNTISSLGSIMINMVLLCACFCLPWHKYLTILLCHMCQHFCHKRLSCAQYPTSHKKKKDWRHKVEKLRLDRTTYDCIENDRLGFPLLCSHGICSVLTDSPTLKSSLTKYFRSFRAGSMTLVGIFGGENLCCVIVWSTKIFIRSQSMSET